MSHRSCRSLSCEPADPPFTASIAFLSLNASMHLSAADHLLRESSAHCCPPLPCTRARTCAVTHTKTSTCEKTSTDDTIFSPSAPAPSNSCHLGRCTAHRRWPWRRHAELRLACSAALAGAMLRSADSRRAFGRLGRWALQRMLRWRVRAAPEEQATRQPFCVCSTLNPQPSTLNPQPPTLNPQPSTLNPRPLVLDRES